MPEPNCNDGFNAEILRRMDSFEAALREQTEFGRVRETLFSALHEHVKKQEGDIEFALKRNLYRRLAGFYDALLFAQNAVANGRPPEEILKSLTGDFLELLDQEEIEPMGLQPERFDRSTQRAVGAEATPSAELDGVVAAVRKEGFVRRDRVIREQEVLVYKHDGSVVEE